MWDIERPGYPDFSSNITRFAHESSLQLGAGGATQSAMQHGVRSDCRCDCSHLINPAKNAGQVIA
jgi:hypothetical protein